MTKGEIITQRVEALRQWMRQHQLFAYIFPSTDPHAGEYVPDYWKVREWISGFNGSAGTAVVTLTRAALWTDSRYWLAAEEQLAGTSFEVIRCGRNVATAQELVEWMSQEPMAGSAEMGIGLDAWTNTAESVEEMAKAAGAAGLTLQTANEPCATLWTKRPPLPDSPIELQPLQYSGRTTEEKFVDIREALQKNGCDALIVSQLDEIAWALNLRGSDVHCTPVFVAYLLVLPDCAILYVDDKKLTREVGAYLNDNHILVCPYAAIAEDLSAGKSGQVDFSGLRFQADFGTTNAALIQALPHCCNAPSPIMAFRAIKNEAEISGFHRAMLRDGVAMVKFLRELQEQPLDGITEMGVDARLTALRAEQEGFRGLSFDTIAGYGAHAAIVHYEATPETDIALEPHGMMLLDSGAQYVDGTTDITRTIPLGPLTAEERRDYTLVLKGHIRLSLAVFPQGTTGTQLDVLARYAMWQDHKNYGHGTGHGVGSYLSVHEGPHQFRMNYVPTPLQAGMTVTVEPGIYIAGSHGCRTENTMLIAGDGDGWLHLEALTLCPIDLRPIVWDMMLPDEIEYLNHYHARVRSALLPLLTDEADKAWLIAATDVAPITPAPTNKES